MNCQLFLVGIAVGASVLYAAIRIGRTFGRRQKDPCAGCSGCKQKQCFTKI